MSHPHPPIYVTYSQDIEDEIAQLERVIRNVPLLAAQYYPRWLAVQLLEGDASLLAKIHQVDGSVTVMQALYASLARLEGLYGDDVDVALADHRYGFVNGLVRSVVTRPIEERMNVSDQIDKVVTNRILGIPIFLGLMWLVFKFTADVSAPLLDWIDGVISGPLTQWGIALLGVVGLGGTWVEALFVDGIIAGVGGVLVFVPVLMALYLVLALLEDSGYMARAAFVMDRLMNLLGLHGKSFLPMIVGFGCTVPAFYATRTLENEKDRILTGLLVPFMSCGARLPVYVLFATIFFSANAGVAIFSMYLLGIATAIVVGILLKNTLFKTAEQAPFVMELPPYRLPTLKGVWSHMWERTAAFVRKAWTIILVVSIAIWLLLAIPVQGPGTFAETAVNDSLFAGVARVIAPVFAPLGFGTWEASGSLLTGFVAKEVVIASIAQVYSVEEAADAIQPTRS
jgi:ferrous iron transport protein B